MFGITVPEGAWRFTDSGNPQVICLITCSPDQRETSRTYGMKSLVKRRRFGTMMHPGDDLPGQFFFFASENQGMN